MKKDAKPQGFLALPPIQITDMMTWLVVKNIEGNLEVKIQTIWTDEKQRWEESEKTREEKKK